MPSIEIKLQRPFFWEKLDVNILYVVNESSSLCFSLCMFCFLPTDLSFFLCVRQEFWIHQYSSVIREIFLFYKKHPAISDAEERCSLLRYAFDTSKINQLDAKYEIDSMVAYNSRYAKIMTTGHQDWRPKITSTRLKALKSYNVGKKQLLSPVSHFVVFSRAAVEHANDLDVIVSISHGFLNIKDICFLINHC